MKFQTNQRVAGIRAGQFVYLGSKAQTGTGVEIAILKEVDPVSGYVSKKKMYLPVDCLKAA